MTSNQIAYGGNLIEQRKVDETIRHNTVMEGLEAQSLDIEKAKVDNDRWFKEENVKYNKEALSLKEQYEYAADLALRTDIEQRMREVDFAKLSLDKEYKTKSLELQSQQNAINADKVAEEIRSNKASEGIRIWANILTDKATELRKYEVDTNAFFSKQRLTYDYARMNMENSWKLKDYNVSMAQIAQNQRRINLQSEELAWNKSKWEQELPILRSKNANAWVNSITPFFIPSADAVLGAASRYLTN